MCFELSVKNTWCRKKLTCNLGYTFLWNNCNYNFYKSSYKIYFLFGENIFFYFALVKTKSRNQILSKLISWLKRCLLSLVLFKWYKKGIFWHAFLVRIIASYTSRLRSKISFFSYSVHLVRLVGQLKSLLL